MGILRAMILFVRAMFASRAELAVENLALRQQLAVTVSLSMGSLNHMPINALAVLETCRRIDLPVALERSRSGNGGHI